MCIRDRVTARQMTNAMRDIESEEKQRQRLNNDQIRRDVYKRQEYKKPPKNKHHNGVLLFYSKITW